MGRCYVDVMNYCLFETAIGPCGVTWIDVALTGVFLPEATVERTRACLLRRHPDAVETAPGGKVAEAVGAMTALLAGEPRDLAEIELEEGFTPEFEAKVYAIARAIPPGSVMTYGEIARKLGDVALSRAVGQALGRNPWPIVVPCHRVLAAEGKAGGFSAPGGAETKLRMLTIERARTPGAPTLFDDLPLALKPGR